MADSGGDERDLARPGSGQGWYELYFFQVDRHQAAEMRFRAGLAARTPGERLMVLGREAQSIQRGVSESEKAVCCCKPLI
jgi:hypothetical protein